MFVSLQVSVVQFLEFGVSVLRNFGTDLHIIIYIFIYIIIYIIFSSVNFGKNVFLVRSNISDGATCT